MRYLKEYEYENDVQAAIDNGELGKPYVAYIEIGNRIDWNTKMPTPPKPDYSKTLFSIVAHSDGIIYYKTTNKSWQRYLFSTATSSEIEPTVAGVPIEVSSGDVVSFYGYSTNSFYKDNNNYCYFDSTAQISLQGNILSVHNYYDDPEDLPVWFPEEGIQDNYFKNLFKGCTNLISAENLFLPYDTAIGCYSNMFEGCTSLTTAPDLLATTSIKSNCYSGMFKGCSSLNYIKCMAESDKGAGYTTSWVDGVAASGTFVQNPEAGTWPTGVNGIPNGWTIEYAS